MMQIRNLAICLACFTASCSPVAKIAVTVQSRSNVVFEVSNSEGSRVCIDYLTVRSMDGAVHWELSRTRNAICTSAISFPTIPYGFEASQNLEEFSKGDYEVEVAGEIYRGGKKFSVP